MASFKPDLRAYWRGASGDVQADQQDRLLSSRSVTGDQLAPDKVEKDVTTRKRIRFRGMRFPLKHVAHKPGILSGELLADTTKRSNAKSTRKGFTIKPSPSVIVRARTLQAGKKGQVARPVFGVEGTRLEAIRDGATAEYRRQMLEHMQAELERERARG